MKNKSLLSLKKAGQSIWLDFISKSLLQSKELQKLVDEGILGVTSNPSIFEQAISKSNDYDEYISYVINQGAIQPKAIYENLAISDIKKACDILFELYEKTNTQEGFVSLELDPNLCDDVEKSVDEAKRLYKSINRTNLMIKVPATQAGFEIIYRLVLSGISVNVTLLFSIESYQQANKAYCKALEERISKNLKVDHIHSVASFFLSRIDTKVDNLLQKIIDAQWQNAQRAKSCLGKTAICLAKKAYQSYEEFYQSSYAKNLLAKGANPQKLLWASTSVKNKNYNEFLYVTNLVFKNTVNTLPVATLESLLKSNQELIPSSIDDIDNHLDYLAKISICIKSITDELLIEGIDIFKKAFMNLLSAIEQKALNLEKKN